VLRASDCATKVRLGGTRSSPVPRLPPRSPLSSGLPWRSRAGVHGPIQNGAQTAWALRLCSRAVRRLLRIEAASLDLNTELAWLCSGGSGTQQAAGVSCGERGTVRSSPPACGPFHCLVARRSSRQRPECVESGGQSPGSEGRVSRLTAQSPTHLVPSTGSPGKGRQRGWCVCKTG